MARPHRLPPRSSVTPSGRPPAERSLRSILTPGDQPDPHPRAQGSPPGVDPWRDAEGTHISFQSRVEQVTVDIEHGALPCRLHQQGQVIGRGTNLVYVIFDRGSQLIALRPHLVRVLGTPDGDEVRQG